MPDDDLSHFCCQDPECGLFGVRDAANLSVCGTFGKHKRIRLLYCSACKARFSERKGTAFFRSGLAPELALSVLRHADSRDGGRPGGSYLVTQGMADPPRRSADLGHDLEFSINQLSRDITNQSKAEQVLYSIPEIAAMLSKHPDTIRDWCRFGRINPARRKNLRDKRISWLITADEIDR
jgi:hypothetical protein